MLERFYNDENKYEISMDEAGRGCLFGRVYVASVILPKEPALFDGTNIKDSKKFSSKKKINEVAEYIKQNFIVLLDGEDKSLVLSRFVFEGSDYTETANLVFKLNEKMTNKKLKIKNTILFDVLEDQTNIVGVKINKTKRTLNFNKNKKEDWVQIN